MIRKYPNQEGIHTNYLKLCEFFRFIFISIYFASVVVALFGCGKSSEDGFFVSPNATEDKILSLSYGWEDPLPDDVKDYPENGFYPTVRVTDRQICLDSRHLETFDLGPRLSICFLRENSTNSESSTEANSILPVSNEVFDSLIDTLLRPDDSRSYPSFRIQSTIGEFSFSFVTEQILRNEWKKTPGDNWFFADGKLIDKLSIEPSYNWFGKSGFISKTYGIPYWNSYKRLNECYVIFSPWDIDVASNTRRLLRIQIPCEAWEKEMDVFIANLSEFNEFQEKSCGKIKPQLIEFFNHSSSRLHRYLEIYNPNKSSICLNSLLVEDSKGKRSLVDWKAKILFPYERIILVDSNSVLEGIVTQENFPWTDLSNGKTKLRWIDAEIPEIDLAKYDLNSEEVLVNISDSLDTIKYFSAFHYEGEFFSRDGEIKNCAKQISPYKTKEKHCGSPGIPSYTLPDSNRFCSIDDLELTEINAFGFVEVDGGKNTRAKFLEIHSKPNLQNSGIHECDISSLAIRIGSNIYPLSFEPKKIRPDQYFIISAFESVPDSIVRIPRNIFNLKWSDSIDLLDSNNLQSKNIYSGLDYYIVEQDIDGIPYSLVQVSREDKKAMIHHPQVLDSKILPNYKIFMSPGYSSFSNEGSIQSNSFKVSISELNWAGSFSNGKSILTDRFIEWKNDTASKTSFLLDFQYPNNPSRNRRFLVPNEGQTYGLLSNSSLTCFPYSKPLIHKDFQLYNDLTHISILDPWDLTLLDHSELDPSLAGLNINSTNTRKSAVRSIISGIWRNSNSFSSHCIGNNFGDPGIANYHTPFVYHASNSLVADDLEKRVFAIRSLGEPRINFQIRFWQPKDLKEVIYDLIFPSNEYVQDITSEIPESNSLVYAYIDEELEGIISSGGLLIEALQPLPGSGKSAWIQICNRSNQVFNTDQLILETDKGRDSLRPSDGSLFAFIYPKQCAVITTNTSQCFLPSFIQNNLFLQFKNTSQFPGGLNSKTAIDLFLQNGTKEIHLHSYGNKYLGEIDTLSLTQAKIAKIRMNTLGGSATNYSIEVDDL
ncbi:hypothetical protein [Leptospira sp. GIMC2001]|uniref:hypothetical protein n=1 Tax=Leptospira sp. GIMC2001 TaxID=1513297 RepID=UPI00234BE553|nr:hypothetical protein [Leptospira sp. GIMC2001]WCL48292.1 hypothetical protein O4O04_13370 [Leptospira sp. GIMC2001]